jgi:hypothetical protein
MNSAHLAYTRYIASHEGDSLINVKSSIRDGPIYEIQFPNREGSTRLTSCSIITASLHCNPKVHV